MEKVKMFFAALKDKRRKNIFKITKEFIHLGIIKREIPFYYFNYLYRKGTIDYLKMLSSNEIKNIVLSKRFHKEEYVNIISNKLNFSLYCEDNNLPIPKLISYNLSNYYYYGGIAYKVQTKQELNDFFKIVFKNSIHNAVFIKPLNSYGGKGCYKIHESSLERDIDLCFDFISKNGCIHEEIVQQHEKINAIYAHSINTIRFDIFIDKHEVPHILSALMRFGVNGSIVDNISSGGFCVGIDLENSKFKKYGHQYHIVGGNEITAHPDNHFVFDGYEVPFFDEAKQLALKASSYIPDRIIGWDIAISVKGPIIIEGNEYPSFFGTEKVYGGYLNNPIFKEILEETKTDLV